MNYQDILLGTLPASALWKIMFNSLLYFGKL